jgi:hypothetical protein
VPGLAFTLLSLFAMMQAEPVQVRPAAELAEDRLAIAVRAREEAQDQYSRGLATTEQLLAWDARVLEAYLACCGRDQDRLKGQRYYLDRATAVHDFEKRRVTARGGQPTPEFLEALYAMHTGAQRLADAEKNAKGMTEAATARIQASQQGFEESLRLLKEGKIGADKALLWSNRWLHAVWVSTEQPAVRKRAIEEHLTRIASVEATLKDSPPPRGRPPVIAAAAEIAFRRAEAELWLTQDAASAQKRLDLAERGRNLLLDAFRKDKVAVQPVLTWLDRWSDARQQLTDDAKAKAAIQEELVRLLREMETAARQHHRDGSRHIAEGDLLLLAAVRLGAEHDLVVLRKPLAT